MVLEAKLISIPIGGKPKCDQSFIYRDLSFWSHTRTHKTSKYDKSFRSAQGPSTTKLMILLAMPSWAKLVQLKLPVCSPPGSCIKEVEEAGLEGWHRIERTGSMVLLGCPPILPVDPTVLETNLFSFILNLDAKRSTSGGPQC